MKRHSFTAVSTRHRAVCALLVGMLASCSSSNHPGMTVLKRLPAQSDPADAFDDQAVLAQMKAGGDNLSKATDIVFFLYIPSGTDALASAAALRKVGFESAIHAPLGKVSDGTTEDRWSVVSHLTAVPTLKTIHHAAAIMTALARRYHGDYDGWEAEVEK